MTIELHAIRMQPRYKLFEHEGSYYIVDIENNLFTFFFPVLSPLFRKRVYSISYEDFMNLKVKTMSTNEIKKLASPPFYICLGGGALAKMLPDGFGNISSNSNLLLYMFIILAILSLRIFLYRKSPVMNPFIAKPVGKVTLRCKGLSGLKFQLISLLMLFVFIGLSNGILRENDSNLLTHFLCGFGLLSYIAFSLGYYQNKEYYVKFIK